MKALPVALRTWKDLRWQIFWFGVGLALYGASIVLIFPQFEDYLKEVAETYPEEILNFFGGGDITSPEGFLTLEYYSFAVLILVIFALVVSTGALAGEESRGTAETLLSHPLRRSRVMIEKGVAVLAASVTVCLVVCIGWLVSKEVNLPATPEMKIRVQRSLTHSNVTTLAGRPVVHVSYQDGIKYYSPNDNWLLLRFSGTEPLLRIFAEADNAEQAQAYIEWAQDRVEQ